MVGIARVVTGMSVVDAAFHDNIIPAMVRAAKLPPFAEREHDTLLPRLDNRRDAVPPIETIIGHFSIENHHFSGAMPHRFCICNRKFKTKLAYILITCDNPLALT